VTRKLSVSLCFKRFSKRFNVENDLAKTENDFLIKKDSANYTIHNYNDVSISFGDI
jgi:hypothetical protein